MRKLPQPSTQTSNISCVTVNIDLGSNSMSHDMTDLRDSVSSHQRNFIYHCGKKRKNTETESEGEDDFLLYCRTYDPICECQPKGTGTTFDMNYESNQTEEGKSKNYES